MLIQNLDVHIHFEALFKRRVVIYDKGEISRQPGVGMENIHQRTNRSTLRRRALVENDDGQYGSGGRWLIDGRHRSRAYTLSQARLVASRYARPHFWHGSRWQPSAHSFQALIKTHFLPSQSGSAFLITSRSQNS